MKKLLLVAGIAAVLLAQNVPFPMIYMRSGNFAFWLRLGQSFTMVDGVLEVRLPVRTLGKKLTFDSNTKTWQGLPASAKNVVIFVNGLRYLVDEDYTLTDSNVIPLSTNFPTNAVVVADYE